MEGYDEEQTTQLSTSYTTAFYLLTYYNSLPASKLHHHPPSQMLLNKTPSSPHPSQSSVQLHVGSQTRGRKKNDLEYLIMSMYKTEHGPDKQVSACMCVFLCVCVCLCVRLLSVSPPLVCIQSKLYP